MSAHLRLAMLAGLILLAGAGGLTVFGFGGTAVQAGQCGDRCLAAERRCIQSGKSAAQCDKEAAKCYRGCRKQR